MKLKWNFPGDGKDLFLLKDYPRLIKGITNYQSPLNNDREKSLKGKVAIVTGASSGIGKSIAIELAKKGVNIVISARNESKLIELTKYLNSLDVKASYYVADVQNEEDCKNLVDHCINTFSKIDILINNAGISMRANFNDLHLDVIKRVMDTNFWGSVYCTKYALPYILKKHGSIVGISSISGITPLPGRTGYVASKHALDGFLETIRLENKDQNLHVMLVHPGFTTSNIRNVALNHWGQAQAESPRNENEMMSSEEVANEVVKGIVYKKENIILTAQGKLISWIYYNMPALANRLIYNEMKKEINAPF
jgi:dehydrogenase/reductase SDR family member 7B